MLGSKLKPNPAYFNYKYNPFEWQFLWSRLPRLRALLAFVLAVNHSKAGNELGLRVEFVLGLGIRSGIVLGVRLGLELGLVLGVGVF